MIHDVWDKCTVNIGPVDISPKYLQKPEQQQLIMDFYKTKVLSVQLGKTLSFEKFVVEWTLDCSSLTLERPTYQSFTSCYA